MRPEDGTPPVRLRTELRKESKLLSPAIPRQTSERGVIVSKNGLPRKPLTRRRLKNLILNVLKNPFNMVVLVSLIILFCLIIIPLLTMISSTFTLAQGELRRVQGHVGDFTLYYWKYILTGTMANAVLWGPLKNSFVCGFFTVLVSVPLGSVLAWLMIRTDIPGKKVLGLLVTVPYMIPSWTKALAWLAMFRNSTSGANGFLAGMGIPIPDWLAYGPIAIVLCMSMHYYAFSYIMVSGALRSINSELEEMGEIQGASKAQILRHITLPLILPSVLSATVMTISKSIGTYGVPANLGNRIGYYTLATKMRNFIDQGPQAVGYAMSIVLVLLAAVIIFSNQRIVGVRKSYATVSGKGGRATLMPLGKAKKPLMAFLMVFLFLAMVVPFFVLIMETFQITTGAGYGLDNLTLYNWIGKSGQIAKYTNYEGIFRNPKFFSAFWNTIRLTLIGSIITAICGQFLGYISSRGRGKVVRRPDGADGVRALPDERHCFLHHVFLHVLPAAFRRTDALPVRHLYPDRADLGGQALPLRQQVRYRQYALHQRGAGGGGRYRRRQLLEADEFHHRAAGEKRLHLRLHADLHLHCQGVGSGHHHDDSLHPDHVLSGLYLLAGGLQPDVRRGIRLRAGLHSGVLHRGQPLRRRPQQEYVSPGIVTEQKGKMI